MRILIYSINYYPEVIGVGKYTAEMGQWFSERGHIVQVITSPPYYPEWKIKINYSNKKYSKELIDTLTVYRCPIYIPKSPKGFKRLLHLLSFSIFSFPILVKCILNSDVLIVIEPTFFIVPPSLLLAKLFGKKLCLHVQDFEIEAAFNLKIIKGKFIRPLIINIEKHIIRRYNLVSSISLSMVNRLLSYGISTKKTHYMPNWSDNKIYKMNKFDSINAELYDIKLNSKIILYSGNIGEKQGLEIVLQVAPLFPDAQFIIVGEGVYKKKLLSLSLEMKLDNLKILPIQPIEKLNLLLNISYIHLVLQKENIQDLAMPSKLSNILATGGVSLISASNGTELANLIRIYGIGFQIIPGSVKSLSDGIKVLLNNKDEYDKISNNAFNYAKNYLKMDKVLCEYEDRIAKLF